ncbi:MAG: TetR/AcrR family transcriptional regulator [Myxococcales bacterium]|nr:TetR/AcrR family transcriptional regulator [Myxococcales bacterium]
MDERRAEVLRTAFELFQRYGYRKTSMDEVARAAGLSRQSLYLWFDGKAALFVAMVEHFLAKLDAAVVEVLASEDPVPARVLAAFDAYVGPTIDVRQATDAVDELLATTEHLVGPQVAASEALFLERIEAALAELAEGVVTPRERAEVLMAASKGMKHDRQDRMAYQERMAVAVRAVCG